MSKSPEDFVLIRLTTAHLDQILTTLQEVNLPHKVTNPIIQNLFFCANDTKLQDWVEVVTHERIEPEKT